MTWPRFVRAASAFCLVSSQKWSVLFSVFDLSPSHHVLNWQVFFYIDNNNNQRTRRLISNRRENIWRPNTHYMAERQVTVLGRHGHMPVGCIVYRRRSPAGRFNSINGSLTQGGEVYWGWGPPRLPAHSDGNVGRLQFLSPPTLL